MSSDYIQSLLVRGIAAAKAGEVEEARSLLERVTYLGASDTEKLEAWFWLSEISTDPREKRNYLEDILIHDMYNARARRSLAVLDGKLDPSELIDPDLQRAPAPPEAVSANSQRFTCPTCGGRMAYSADGQSLVCEYCTGQQQLLRDDHAQQVVEEKDFVIALATAKGHGHPVATRLLICEGCGAHFFMPPEQMSLSCPYCNSPHVVVENEVREILTPDGVVPFKIDKEQYRKILRNWFLEDELEPRPRVAVGRGVYLPAWTFDLGGTVTWRCQVKRNRQWEVSNGDRTIQKNDLLMFATTHIHKTLFAASGSYDLKEMAPYDARFLADWPAETYQIPVADASLEARRITLEAEQKKVAERYFQPIRNLWVSSAKMVVESFRLVLLPAWLTHYFYEDQRYEVLVNGQTGVVVGERPKRGLGKFLDRLLGMD